jgi:gluconokinase
MASGTGLLTLKDCRWDASLASRLGVELDSLPELGEAGQGLDKKWALRWPELKDVPWVCAAGDGALANFGSGCTDETERALTIGTSGALRVLYKGLPKRIPDGLWCYRLDRERAVCGGSFSNGGNLYAWMTETLAVEQGTLEARVRRMRPATHGLTFVPLLAGERSPGWASHATGSIAGLTLATTPLDLVRAGLEAVAIEFRRVDERLDGVLPGARRLIANGAGLLASPAWMQMMADAIGKPVAASRSREASARGAALLALEHIGALDGNKLKADVGRTFDPDPQAAPAYAAETRRQELLYRFLIADRALDKVELSTPSRRGGD